jgi:putative ABC transport system permease protein
MLWDSNPKAGEEHVPVMEGAFAMLLDDTQVFEGMAGFSLPMPKESLYPEKLWGTEESVSIAGSTMELFSLLRVAPILGRTFDASEMILWSSPRVAILSDSFWLRHYGGSRDVIGKTLDLNGFGVETPATVVGVMPQGFDFPYPLSPEKPDLWVNIPHRAPSFLPGSQSMVLARLKNGTTIQQAQADVDTVAARIRQQYAKYFADETIQVVPLQSELIQNIRPMMWVMLGAAGCLLLIGCANTGNLLFARAVSRQRELGIRAALGAGPAALVRLMLTETLLLAGAGGILGSFLAHWSHRALARIVPPSIYVPRLDSVAHDFRLLILTAGILVVVAAGLTVIPCLRLRRPSLDETLKLAGPGLQVGRSFRLRSGSFLLVSQVSLALALLVGTVVLGESLERLLEANRAFQPDHLLVADVGFSNAAFRSTPNFREREPSLYHPFEERIKSLPGVQSVALADHFPFASGGDYRFKADGTGLISENFQPADQHLVSPGFLEIMNLKLVRGRWLAETDTLQSSLVAVINQAMADRYWPHSDPLGRNLWPMFRFTSKNVLYTVVGVVQEPKRFGAGDRPQPAVYQTIDQVSPPFFSVLIKTAGDPRAIASVVRSAAIEMQPGQTVAGRIRTGGEVVSEATAKLRATAVLLSSFTLLALLLAALGVYGLVSYHTSLRTHEIGVRMALGARPPDLLRMVFREGMALVAVGTLIGLALSFGLSRILRSLLYEAPVIDIRALSAATVVFLVVALVAIYIPAHRATKVDPMVVLRYE